MDNEDTRPRTVGDREYTMVSTETWIDVKDLTINIFKGKKGIKLYVYPREMPEECDPLAVCEVEYLKESRKKSNVIAFEPYWWEKNDR